MGWGVAGVLMFGAVLSACVSGCCFGVYAAPCLSGVPAGVLVDWHGACSTEHLHACPAQ
jgi:hypothetical protein